MQKKQQANENDIRSFMILVRKLLDKMSQADQVSYLTTRLFCNWILHIEITKLNTGLKILAEINDTLVEIKDYFYSIGAWHRKVMPQNALLTYVLRRKSEFTHILGKNKKRGLSP